MTATTRSGTKKAGAPPASEAEPGTKHKTAEGAGSPNPKRSKKEEKKEQKTTKETPSGQVCFIPVYTASL
jgi:hypothetical protein